MGNLKSQTGGNLEQNGGHQGWGEGAGEGKGEALVPGWSFQVEDEGVLGCNIQVVCEKRSLQGLAAEQGTPLSPKGTDTCRPM